MGIDFWTTQVHHENALDAGPAHRGLRELDPDRVRIATAPVDGPTATLPPNWTERSACLDHEELFDSLYPNDFDKGIVPGRRDSERAARAVCDVCPVKDQCLEFAMEREVGPFNQWRYGMFGGLMPAERKALA